MKKLILIIIFAIFSEMLSAQETIFEEKRTIYKREQAFGLLIHTRGWGLTYRYGQYTSGFNRRTYELELLGMKHPKQTKIFTSPFDNSNGYVFGQISSILILRASIGNHKTFISKQSVRGIAIASIVNIGLSLAYAKPIYLEVIDTSDVFTNTAIERYDPNKYDQSNIIGSSSPLRGLFEGTFYPGVFLKAGLNFESSRQASRINALEVGAVLDVYFRKIPIMDNELNKPYFFNLYVTLTFGSKKTN